MTLSDKSYYRRLCRNILADRFNWRKYCTPSLYFGREICVTPLHCSYGQIGYTINFPYTNAPEVEYDWEMNKLTIGDENWKIGMLDEIRQNGKTVLSGEDGFSIPMFFNNLCGKNFSGKKYRDYIKYIAFGEMGFKPGEIMLYRNGTLVRTGKINIEK